MTGEVRAPVLWAEGVKPTGPCKEGCVSPTGIQAEGQQPDV